MIQFVNVTKVYENGLRALNNVNLQVAKGEFVFIVGKAVPEIHFNQIAVEGNRANIRSLVCQ